MALAANVLMPKLRLIKRGRSICYARNHVEYVFGVVKAFWNAHVWACSICSSSVWMHGWWRCHLAFSWLLMCHKSNYAWNNHRMKRQCWMGTDAKRKRMYENQLWSGHMPCKIWLWYSRHNLCACGRITQWTRLQRLSKYLELLQQVLGLITHDTIRWGRRLCLSVSTTRSDNWSRRFVIRCARCFMNLGWGLRGFPLSEWLILAAGSHPVWYLQACKHVWMQARMHVSIWMHACMSACTHAYM